MSKPLHSRLSLLVSFALEFKPQNLFFEAFLHSRGSRCIYNCLSFLCYHVLLMS